MERMPQLVRKGKKDRRMGEPKGIGWDEIQELDVDGRVEPIRAVQVQYSPDTRPRRG